MNDEITSYKYWQEIESIADDLAERSMSENDNDIDAARNAIYDNMLHEDIDGHQWVIYNGYSLEVIQHSNNDTYASDNFGDDYLSAAMRDGGLDRVHAIIAFWCMYADVSEAIDDALESYEVAA